MNPTVRKLAGLPTTFLENLVGYMPNETSGGRPAINWYLLGPEHPHRVDLTGSQGSRSGTTVPAILPTFR